MSNTYKGKANLEDSVAKRRKEEEQSPSPWNENTEFTGQYDVQEHMPYILIHRRPHESRFRTTQGYASTLSDTSSIQQKVTYTNMQRYTQTHEYIYICEEIHMQT